MHLFSVSLAALSVFVAFASPSNAQQALIKAARARVGVTLVYDPSYISIAYPGGDVADNSGVCTDVLIRALRTAYAYDLQKQVHEDMAAHFSAYPDRWGLKRPDANIDHRRVPNLEAFLSRQGARIDGSTLAEDFLPGDIVTWRVSGWMPHIGIVSDKESVSGVPLIIHNMGWGTREDDILMQFPLAAHFRFHPDRPATP